MLLTVYKRWCAFICRVVQGTDPIQVVENSLHHISVCRLSAEFGELQIFFAFELSMRLAKKSLYCSVPSVMAFFTASTTSSRMMTEPSSSISWPDSYKKGFPRSHSAPTIACTSALKVLWNLAYCSWCLRSVFRVGCSNSCVRRESCGQSWAKCQGSLPWKQTPSQGLQIIKPHDFSCFPRAVNTKPVWTTVGVVMGGRPVQEGKERQMFMKFSKVPYVFSLADRLAIFQDPALTGRSSPMWYCRLKWSRCWTPSDVKSL